MNKKPIFFYIIIFGIIIFMFGIILWLIYRKPKVTIEKHIIQSPTNHNSNPQGNNSQGINKQISVQANQINNPVYTNQNVIRGYLNELPPRLYNYIPQVSTSGPLGIDALDYRSDYGRNYDILKNFGIQKLNAGDEKFKLIGVLYNNTCSPQSGSESSKVCRKIILNLYERKDRWFKDVLLYQRDLYDGAKYIVQDKDGFFSPLRRDKDCVRDGDIITNIPPFTDQGPFTVELY